MRRARIGARAWSRFPRHEPLRAHQRGEAREPPRFVLERRPAGRLQRERPPPVAARGRHLFDEAAGFEPLERAVDRPRPHRRARRLFDRLHDGVAMQRPFRERQEDMEDGGRERYGRHITVAEIYIRYRNNVNSELRSLRTQNAAVSFASIIGRVPQPDGPSRAKSSPECTLTSRRAGWVQNVFERFRSSILIEHGRSTMCPTLSPR